MNNIAVDHDVPGVTSDYTKTEQLCIERCKDMADISRFIEDPTLDTVEQLIDEAYRKGHVAGQDFGIDLAKEVFKS